MIAYIAIAVGLVCFILYVLDRKSKAEPIDWITAIKLSMFGSALSAGVAFVTTGEKVVEVIKQLPPEVPPVQDMFVGIPTF
jgi:hypothetical protein